MKILCVGQNYAKHVAELGSAPNRQPVWFWKPDTAIVEEGGAIRLPSDIGDIHHEVELAVRIGDETGPDGAPVPDAFTVAIDVTARTLQNQDKASGRPWQQAKGYDTFLPLGPWQDAAGVDLQDLRLRLTVNGEVRQDGSTGDMTWPVADLLRLAAGWTTLRPGDILLTGTPHGVSPIVPGDQVVAEVVGHVRGSWRAEAR